MRTPSQRLAGLELLKTFGLPVPDWQLVRDPEEVEQLVLGEAAHGWTVRTFREDGASEIGGFFANHVPPTSVRPLLRDRLAVHAGVEGYIVYASWAPVAFLNILCDGDTFNVEGALKEANYLSRGRHDPDFAFRVDRFDRLLVWASMPESTRHGVQRILRWCRKLPFDRFYTEAAITLDRKVLFYDLFKVDRPLIKRPVA